ncbi:MAG: hypothetical protein Q8M03_05095 [Legionella sp.]|nr:hypothetical protein [Legionella sp.]
MKKQKGMILINTLLMISVIALIVLSQVQLIFLQFRAMNELISRHQAFRQLEAAANQLITGSMQGLNQRCLVPRRDNNDIVDRIKHKEGCALSINKKQYQFFIENLGAVPCLEITINDQLYTTRHQRFTVALMSNKPLILQIRMASAGDYIMCDSRQSTQIQPGILSWRYLG